MKETRSNPASAKRERGQRRAGLEKRVDVDGDEQEERFAGLDVEFTRKRVRGSACALIQIRL
jgi:hypothetical protein